MRSHSVSATPPRPGPPGVWGWLQLCLAAHRMHQRALAGANRDVIKIGEQYLTRWKGNVRFYARMTAAQWGVSHWQETIRYGRMALALKSNQPTIVVFMLAAYRSAKEGRRGIAFGERWIATHGVKANVCRHLSFLFDDLDLPAQALQVARRGLQADSSNLQLASCAANYMAKTEGAENALKFVESYRARFSGNSYCENTLADGLNSCGAYDQAEKIFASIHAREPQNPTPFYNLLNNQVQAGKYAEVVTAVKQWDTGQTLTAPIANEAARACLELGRNDDALAWMQRACDLAPRDPKYADNYAISLGRAGRRQECVTACRERLAANQPVDRRRLLTALAVACTELGQHEDAFREYRRAFAEFPANGEALINVMVGFTWLNRFAEAAAFGEEHRAARGATLPVRYWRELAWALHKAGQFSEEEKIILEWHRLYPDDIDVLRTMKRCLNRLDRASEALAFIRDWAGAHPGEPWGWRYLAEQYSVTGNADEEIAVMARACQTAPENAEFVDARLTMLRRLNRPQEAFDLGQEWIAAHPENVPVELLNRIGLAADDLEHWPVAEEYYSRAHRLQPKEPVWAGNLIRALIYGSRLDEAIKVGRGWLADHPWDNYVAAKLAWAYHQTTQFKEEAEVLNKALRIDPKHEESNHALLSSLIAQKATEQAGELLDRCQAESIATSRFFNDWGNHQLELDHFAEAETAYRKALELGPNNAVAAGNLGSLLVRGNRAVEAGQFCREWLERRPDDSYVRRQLANVYYVIDDYAPAEAEYRTLLAKEPKSSFLFGRLMACLRLSGKHEAVLAESTLWLETNQTGSAFLFTEMGIAAGYLEKPEAALQHFETALKLEPALLAAAIRKMRTLDNQGKLGLGIEFGAQWAAAHAADADAGFHNELAILLDRAGKADLARQGFLRAVKLDPNNPTLAGNAVEILGRHHQVLESITLGQQLLANSPPNAYLLRRLAESYSKHHEHLPALDLLSSADVLEPTDADVALAFLRIAHEGTEFERGTEFGRMWLSRPGNKEKANVWARFARLCFRADLDGEALEALQTALTLEPDEISHVRLRFAFLNSLGESGKLTTEFEAVRPEWRTDSPLMTGASRAYLDLGMEAEALDLAVENTKANPAEGEACAWLAELHDKAGRAETAKESVRQWIEIHGDCPALLKVRAGLALHDEDYAQALTDAEKVLSQDNSDEESFVICIRALRAVGRGPEARSRLHHWIEHEKSSEKINRLLDEEFS